MNDVYADIKAYFADKEGVIVNSGKGSQGIKVNGKMFVMFSKGDLLVKLPPVRVTALVESGAALPYDPGTGKTMADRVLVPVSNSSRWIQLAEESLEYGGWER